MISREHFDTIKNKYGEFASWAVWADEDGKPKSNIGDIDILNPDININLLSILNPQCIMVGLNFSRAIERIDFVNFHDKRSQ